MGRKDIALTTYLSDHRRFADLFNGCLFGGEKIIEQSELTEEDSVQSYRGRNLYLKKTRDKVMKYGKGAGYVVLAVENQNETDYVMPLRNLLYEALEYERQRQELARRHKEEQRQKKTPEHKSAPSEYLSGFYKDDRLCPIITLVVYYGKEPWQGAKDLYGILDFTNQNPKLKKYVQNYELNLFHYAEHDSFEMFQTELGALFGFLRYSEQKDKLQDYVKQHPEAYDNIDEETYHLIADLTGSEKMLEVEEKCKTEEGGYDMCKAIADMIEDGRIEGRTEGEDLFAVLVKKLLKDSRMEELTLAVNDKEMRKVLYAEYHINLNEK